VRISRQAGFLQVGESATVGGRVNVDANHIIVRARYEHILWCLNNGVALFKSHYRILEIIIRVVKINIDTPRQLSARILVTLVCSVTGDPDAIIGNYNSLRDGIWRLSPFEVKDVVRHKGPVLSNIFCVVEFFVNAAGFIYVFKLSASSPRGCKGPAFLGWMENELLDAFT
jgi:hypothetical protein